MAGTSFTKSFKRLENELHRGFHSFWAKHLSHLCVYLFDSERAIDLADSIMDI